MISLDRKSTNKRSGIYDLYDRICYKASLENIRHPNQLLNDQILHLIFSQDRNMFNVLSIQNFQYGVRTKFKKMKAGYSDIKYINKMIKFNLSESLKYSSFDKSIKLSELDSDNYCSDCDFTWLS